MDRKPVAGTKYLGVGITWAVTVGLFLYLGSRLDERLNAGSVFTLAGAFIGIVAGFIWLLWMLKQDRDGSK